MKKKSLLLAGACLPLVMTAHKVTADNRLQYSVDDAHALTAKQATNRASFTFSNGGRKGAVLKASDPYSPGENGSSSAGDDVGGAGEGGAGSSVADNSPVASFDANGIHVTTGTHYDEDGYNAGGWTSTGYNINTGTEYDEDGFDKNGWKYANGQYVNKATGTAYDEDGYNRSGYDADGFDKNGWKYVSGEGYINKDTGTKFDPSGKDYYGCEDTTGWDTNYRSYSGNGVVIYKNLDTGTWYDSDGYNSLGFNADGINKNTGTPYNTAGYDKNGYDADGYNKSGYDRNGYDRDGYDSYGWDRNGYDSTGYDYYGYNADGNHVSTGTPYTSEGYDRWGYDVDDNFACVSTCCGGDRNGDYVTDRSGGYCQCGACCYPAGTLITLADGSVKPVEEVTYDDELLVWNFDDGCFDKAKPIWIKVPQVSPQYEYARFSDGSELKTINQHRIFNQEAGKFTYAATDDTPLGTHTLNAKGEFVELVEQKIVREEVTYYNIITERHLNCFAGGVLTSCRLNNIYPIKDMKFVKDDRKLTPYEAFKGLDRKWYDGLRLSEQSQEINRQGDINLGFETLSDYVKNLLDLMADIQTESLLSKAS